MILALDTETTGLDLRRGCQPFSVAACSDKGQTWFWRWQVNPITRIVSPDPDDLDQIAEICARSSRLVFHNAKFDVHALSNIGFHLCWDKIDDTLLMSHVLDANSPHGLKDLALRHLQFPTDDQEALLEATRRARVIAKVMGWTLGSQVAYDTWMPGQLDYPLSAFKKDVLSVKTYNVNDAKRTMLLYQLFAKLLFQRELSHLYERERVLQPIVYDMESNGISLNTRTLFSEKSCYSADRTRHERYCRSFAKSRGIPDLNVGSAKQLRSMLYDKDKLALPVLALTDKSKVPSTDRKVIEALGKTHKHPFLRHLLNFRRADKAIGYLNEYEQEAYPTASSHWVKIHPNINQVGYDDPFSHSEGKGMATTRFSCSKPNMQNVSKQSEMPLRKVFGPPPGKVWLTIDYKNLELRLIAYDAQEPQMIAAFERGESVHILIGKEIWGPKFSENHPHYKHTKNGNFSITYSAGEAHADETYHKVGAYRTVYSHFAPLSTHKHHWIKVARSTGLVHTLFGYPLPITPDREYTTAVSYRIQGTAGDILKYALINLSKLDGYNKYFFLLIPVHDEIVIELDRPVLADRPYLVPQIVAAMEEPGTRISIPCPVDVKIVLKSWDRPIPYKPLRKPHEDHRIPQHN